MRRFLGGLLVALLTITVVLLADYAHVESATPVLDDATPWNITIDTTAGNALIAAWSTGETGSDSCGSLATNQSDTEETLVELRAFGTALRICIAVICNAAGGSTTLTVTHGGGATAEVYGVSEFSGVSDSSCIEDSATGTASADTITTDAVDTAAAGMIYGFILTNRNPAVAGSGSPTQRWEGGPSSTSGFTGNAQDKRATGAGSHTLQWDLDVSGAMAYGIVALTESGGAPASPLPAMIGVPRGGGVNFALVNQGDPRPNQGIRMVQTVTR